MHQEENPRFFIKCALPVEAREGRKLEEFYLNDRHEWTNSSGSEFIIVPFKSGNFFESQIATDWMNYKRGVDKAIKKISSGDLKKVILSKIKYTQRPSGSLAGLFEKLLFNYPGSFVYEMNHPIYGRWMGATPELLLQRKSNFYSTVSLAGTQARHESSDYHWNEKLLYEQKLVTDFIATKLVDLGVDISAIEGPENADAGPVVHLKTTFRFFSDLAPDAIAGALHPTPAICGIPREKAASVIDELEGHERRLYTGYLGIRHANGDVNYFVNLRCMQIFEDHFELYLGGGITGDSDPESEWQETEQKAKVLLSFIQ